MAILGNIRLKKGEQMTDQERFQLVVDNQSDADLREKIDEYKGEYVRDWEDEFDDIHEAYEEQGRGEAEAQAVKEAIDKVFVVICPEEYLRLYDALMDYWCL
jgi:hypothetical protein